MSCSDLLDRCYLDLADALCGLGVLEGRAGAEVRLVRVEAAVGAAPLDRLCDRAVSALGTLQVAAADGGDLRRLRMLSEAAGSVGRVREVAAGLSGAPVRS